LTDGLKRAFAMFEDLLGARLLYNCITRICHELLALVPRQAALPVLWSQRVSLKAIARGPPRVLQARLWALEPLSSLLS
jgi:hypothetical protein